MEHCPERNFQHEIPQTTFDTFYQSQHLLYTAQSFYFSFSCVFNFPEIIKHNMSKVLLFPSTFNIKMVTLKIDQI